MNQYDVIHLDIANFRRPGDDSMDMLRWINTEAICELQKIYPGILNEDENSIPHALAQLNEAVKASFVIVIDEWDAIFREFKDDIRAQEEYVELLRGGGSKAHAEFFDIGL